MINYIINDGSNVLIEKTCLGEFAYLNCNTICILYFISYCVHLPKGWGSIDQCVIIIITTIKLTTSA